MDKIGIPFVLFFFISFSIVFVSGTSSECIKDGSVRCQNTFFVKEYHHHEYTPQNNLGLKQTQTNHERWDNSSDLAIDKLMGQIRILEKEVIKEQLKRKNLISHVDRIISQTSNQTELKRLWKKHSNHLRLLGNHRHHHNRSQHHKTTIEISENDSQNIKAEYSDENNEIDEGSNSKNKQCLETLCNAEEGISERMNRIEKETIYLKKTYGAMYKAYNQLASSYRRLQRDTKRHLTRSERLQNYHVSQIQRMEWALANETDLWHAGVNYLMTKITCMESGNKDTELCSGIDPSPKSQEQDSEEDDDSSSKSRSNITKRNIKHHHSSQIDSNTQNIEHEKLITSTESPSMKFTTFSYFTKKDFDLDGVTGKAAENERAETGRKVVRRPIRSRSQRFDPYTKGRGDGDKWGRKRARHGEMVPRNRGDVFQSEEQQWQQGSVDYERLGALFTEVGQKIYRNAHLSYIEGRPRDCSEIDLWTQRREPIQTIYLDDQKTPVQVSCDEGWTIIQRFPYEATDKRPVTWLESKYGIGFLDTSSYKGRRFFWIGNDYLHRITKGGDFRLKIEMTYVTNDEDNVGRKRSASHYKYAEYAHFKVKSEADNYALGVMGSSGTAGDIIGTFSGYNDGISLVGMSFATQNKNDDQVQGRLAAEYGAGWWYPNTTRYEENRTKCFTNLNAKRPWFCRRGYGRQFIENVVMKIRLNQNQDPVNVG